jgi:hypothetical protein
MISQKVHINTIYLYGYELLTGCRKLGGVCVRGGIIFE